MQRKIESEIELGKRIASFDSIGASSTIDRTALSYTDTGDKVRKIRKLIETGTYDAEIVRYIPGAPSLAFQGMLENIETKEHPAHSSYRDMENLDFQILLIDNYYTKSNSMYLCFPMKIKKATYKDSDIDYDSLTVNIFFFFFLRT